MPSDAQPATASRGQLWTGRIIATLLSLFLVFDAVAKFFKPRPVVDAFERLNFPLSLAVPIGVILLICVLLYLIPQTSILGAILLTGYLGGAVCTHLRHQDPLFSTVLFPVYFGILIWLSLFLREPRLRTLIPFRR